MEKYDAIVPSEYKPRYNAAPAQPILTVTQTATGWEARMTEWGFQSGTMHRIINARIETVHEKPLFKPLFSHHRCLIPASGYYEWKHEGSIKTPYYFSAESEPLFSFAGLIRPLSSGDQVVILTTRAPPPYSEIHERMPVILSSANEPRFLSEGTFLIDIVLRMFEVSSRVNQVAFDEPDLTKPWKNTQEQKTLADLL